MIKSHIRILSVRAGTPPQRPSDPHRKDRHADLSPRPLCCGVRRGWFVDAVTAVPARPITIAIPLSLLIAAAAARVPVLRLLNVAPSWLLRARRPDGAVSLIASHGIAAKIRAARSGIGMGDSRIRSTFAPSVAYRTSPPADGMMTAC